MSPYKVWHINWPGDQFGLCVGEYGEWCWVIAPHSNRPLTFSKEHLVLVDAPE